MGQVSRLESYAVIIQTLFLWQLVYEISMVYRDPNLSLHPLDSSSYMEVSIYFVPIHFLSGCAHALLYMDENIHSVVHEVASCLSEQNLLLRSTSQSLASKLLVAIGQQRSFMQRNGVHVIVKHDARAHECVYTHRRVRVANRIFVCML